MSAELSDKAVAVAELLVRGDIALTLLTQLAQHVADYDSDKAQADKIYQGRVIDAQSALVNRITASVRRAQAVLDTVGTPDDDIDDDDD